MLREDLWDQLHADEIRMNSADSFSMILIIRYDQIALITFMTVYQTNVAQHGETVEVH